MGTTQTGKMNHFIPHNLDDEVFFYARRLINEREAHWNIHIDPNECLVSLKDMGDGMPMVEELRQGKLQKQTTGDQISYEGRVLFSGGIILTVNGKILMLFRDEGAPVEPLKWTSPSGRCDREPLLTSLKEFYEEVIIYDQISGNPIFVEFQDRGYTEDLKKIYSKTLKTKGFDKRFQQWEFIQAEMNNRFSTYLHKVQTSFGPYDQSNVSINNEIYQGNFFTYFDEEGNTLEMRLLAALSISAEKEAQLAFQDGEYERDVKLFSKEDFMLLDEESLVHTMTYFRKEINW